MTHGQSGRTSRRRCSRTPRSRCTGTAASGPRCRHLTLAPAGTRCWGSRRCHVPMPGLWGPASSSSTSEYQTLILHWNGRKWSRARAPRSARSALSWLGSPLVSRSDAWAVGRFDNASNFDNPLILHWNGRSWGRARAPARASSLEELLAVAASSAARAWAVGLGPCVGGGVDCPSHSLTLRWNGTRWAAVSSPSVSDSRDQNILTGVAMASGGVAWAAAAITPPSPTRPSGRCCCIGPGRPGARTDTTHRFRAAGGFAARCEALGWERSPAPGRAGRRAQPLGTTINIDDRDQVRKPGGSARARQARQARQVDLKQGMQGMP